MKIQPIDYHTLPDEPTRFEPVKPVVKSRLKRLFERQFTSVLKISVAEKTGVDEPHFTKDGFNGSGEFEPSSVCLAKMVQNFIEESNDKSLAAAKCGRSRCNCFNGSCNDGSVDELNFFCGIGDSNFVNFGEACEILKVASYMTNFLFCNFEFCMFRKRCELLPFVFGWKMFHYVDRVWFLVPVSVKEIY